MKPRQHKYSYLVDKNLIEPRALMEVISRSRKEGINVEDIFLNDHKIKREDIGKSLEIFYNTPYFGFTEENALPKNLFNGLNMNYLKNNFWVPVQNDKKVVVLVTILGLAPMVAPLIFPGWLGQPEGQAANWAPTCLVILGGLTTSTFLTLLIIPTVYTLVDDMSGFFRRVAYAA